MNFIDELLKELENLKEARDILEQIYIYYGAYGNGEIPENVRYRMADYFGFDDSE